MGVINICVLLTIVLHCNGLNILEHPLRDTRRFNLPGEKTAILGAPSYPNHLPAAQPILPGHTLIRPSVSMLKSAVKFPHIDQENGAGVYGHFDNLGIKYAGKQERVLYSGFRRSLPKLLPAQLQQLLNYKKKKVKLRKPPLRGATHKIKKLGKNRKHKKILTIYPVKILPIKTSTSESQKTKLKDILRIITSLRRDRDLKETEEERPKKYVPGSVVPGSFIITDPDPDEGVVNKTALFWNTKDAFNHIKLNPEAPELTELLPLEAYDNMRNWWFYHQADFEEFEDR